MFLTRTTTIMHFFFLSHLAFLIIGSHIVSNSVKFHEGSWVQQTPVEGRRTYRPKHCGNNNKDEDNSPKTLKDKNQQVSSQI